MFDGSWRCRIHAPVGAQDVILVIREAGGSLVGEVKGAAETVPMLVPQVRDGRLRWTQQVTRPMRLTVAFNIGREGDRLLGTAKAGVFPRVRVDGVRMTASDPEREERAVARGEGVATSDASGRDAAVGHHWPRLSVDTSDRGPRPVVGMFAFPGMTGLDLIGPHAVLSGPAEVVLVASQPGPVTCDTGVVIHADVAMADAPAELDVLFVPGGPGQVGVMADRAALSFLADRGSRARYVTSACTGSLILGAAGLLEGYRATTHWAALDLLRTFGAEPVEARVVVDRGRITGGGVTAGIDFGLVLLRELFDEEVARTTQLLMEYAPQPPFRAGRPDEAGEATVEAALRVMAPAAREVMEAIAAWTER